MANKSSSSEIASEIISESTSETAQRDETTRETTAHAETTREEIADRLHSAAIHLLRRVRRLDLALGLTPARLSVLSVLVFSGPKTLGELASAEQVTAPTMTRLVAGLERDHLLRRDPDPHDRRITRVAATPRAARLMQKGRQARIHDLAHTLASLTNEELSILSRATQILRDLNAKAR